MMMMIRDWHELRMNDIDFPVRYPGVSNFTFEILRIELLNSFGDWTSVELSYTSVERSIPSALNIHETFIKSSILQVGIDAVSLQGA